MFNKVGVFHFVRNYEDPISELERALERCEVPVNGALVVLPEGFNIRKPYKTMGNCNVDPGVVALLRKTASRFHVVFVAGLIVDERQGVDPPYNSAYLIDEFGRALTICRKLEKDDWHVGGSNDARNYTPCDRGYDCNNPLMYRDVCIGALICKDAFPEGPGSKQWKRFEEVLGNIDHLSTAHNGAQGIVCIPSCMAGDGAGKQGEVPIPHKGTIFVLANSDSRGMNSWITTVGGRIEKAFSGRENMVGVLTLQS